jgi:hypothetical protein
MNFGTDLPIKYQVQIEFQDFMVTVVIVGPVSMQYVVSLNDVSLPRYCEDVTLFGVETHHPCLLYFYVPCIICMYVVFVICIIDLKSSVELVFYVCCDMYRL